MAEQMADGTTGSYLFDLQGNTAEIITGSGVKVNAAYNAWGQCNYMNPVPFPNDPFMQHAYNARWEYLLDETGLYYCQNRYYDPGTGRFLTRDPISYSGGMNLYGYCGGGPVGAADPSGLLTMAIEFANGVLGSGQFAVEACTWHPLSDLDKIPYFRPPGVTPLKDFIEVYECIMRAHRASQCAESYSVVELMVIYREFQNKGSKDYKQKWKGYEDYGNWNYGVVLTLLNYDSDFVHQAAAYAQSRSGNRGEPDKGGDATEDYDWIDRGIRYANKIKEKKWWPLAKPVF